MTINNPFLINNYHSPEYFCDRKMETNRILKALGNHRNITLISLRRMGKTGLIHHVFHHLSKNKTTACFYLDILATRNLDDFINAFGKAVLGKLDTTPSRALKKISSFFSTLRPVIAYDTLTGQPSVEFSLQHPEDAPKTLEQIFKYLGQQNKKIIIAIDEFQQIVNYPEKNTEALLRTHIQKLSNVNFIFSGSHKHLLLSMFSDYGRPFYQSTELVHLGPIDQKEYTAFIQSHFEKAGKKISSKQIKKVLEWTHIHTFYVQYAFNKLYNTSRKQIKDNLIANTLLTILEENEVVYYNYRSLLTVHQWNLLSAIAKEEKVKMPTSKDFIKNHDLNTPSSVKTALKALVDKEMIYREDGAYHVYDVFLSRWLERN